MLKFMIHFTLSSLTMNFLHVFLFSLFLTAPLFLGGGKG